MEPLYLCKMPSPIGELTLAAAENALTRIVLPACLPPGKGIYAQTPLLQQAMEQLCAYFAGELREFSLPIAPKGTPFEQRVWKALCAIPYGETRTYGQIAAAAGSPRGFRAAGMANHKNPLAIVIPCHRVIGANGSLTGYAGGLETKKFLLALEQRGKGPSHEV